MATIKEMIRQANADGYVDDNAEAVCGKMILPPYGKEFFHATVSKILHRMVRSFLHISVSSFLHQMVRTFLHTAPAYGE